VGKSCGAFNGKEWTYIRDVLWPNLRKTTMVSTAYSEIYMGNNIQTMIT
jgi:hypothetical protein